MLTYEDILAFLDMMTPEEKAPALDVLVASTVRLWRPRTGVRVVDGAEVLVDELRRVRSIRIEHVQRIGAVLGHRAPAEVLHRSRDEVPAELPHAGPVGGARRVEGVELRPIGGFTHPEPSPWRSHGGTVSNSILGMSATNDIDE